MSEAEDRVATINRMLSERGHRVTRTRTLILEVIAQAEAGLCAEEIYAHLREADAGVNLSTVYRNLEMLLRLRMVSALDVGGGMRYRLLTPGQQQHYLVCNYCGRVREVELMYLAPLRDRLLMGYNFEPEFSGFTIHGRCDHCRSGGLPRQEDFEIADLRLQGADWPESL